MEEVWKELGIWVAGRLGKSCDREEVAICRHKEECILVAAF